jgi:hypothetical protein
MAGQFCLWLWLPHKSQGFFTCCKSAAWGKQRYFPSEGRHAEDFFARKNLTASAGFEPANSSIRGQHTNHLTTEAASIHELLTIPRPQRPPLSASQSVPLMRQIHTTVLSKQKKNVSTLHTNGGIQNSTTLQELMVIQGFYISIQFHIFKKCSFSDFN